MSFIYENEFEKILRNKLIEKFNLSDETIEEYILYRYFILHKRKSFKINIEEISKFIAREIFINTNQNHFNYKNEKFYFDNPLSQSISNILTNWKLISVFLDNDLKAFNVSSENKTRMDNIINNSIRIINKSNRKSANLDSNFKLHVFNYYALKELNKLYNISIKEITIPNTIEPISEHYYSGQNIEDISERYLHLLYFDSNDYKLLKESEVEDFIFRNFNKIFPNKKLKGRQIDIGKGSIIDILCEDNKFEYIIELKNKKDDRLYWQVIKYKKFYNSSKKLKIITLSPEYDKKVVNELKKLDYVEILEFEVKIENKKLTEIKIRRIYE